MAGVIPTPVKRDDSAIISPQFVQDIEAQRVFNSVIDAVNYIKTQLHDKTPLVEVKGDEIILVDERTSKEGDVEKHQYNLSWQSPFVEEEVEEEESEGIRFYNNAGMTIPAFAAMEITSFQSDGTAVVQRPSEDNIDASLVIFNGNEEVASGQSGLGYSPFDGIYPVTFSGSASIGDDLGTEADSFDLLVDNTGMTYIGSDDGSKANVRPKAGSGTTILWAKITVVGDANNYTVSIYDRSDEGTPIESNKQCRVFDIVDQLSVGDWIPVQTSNISGVDYESIQQMGAVG